jgi:predicted ATP-grasp superfamily ATP-dependent carboligase
VSQNAVITAIVDGEHVSLSMINEEMTVVFSFKNQVVIAKEGDDLKPGQTIKLKDIVDRVFRAVNDGEQVDGVQVTTVSITTTNTNASGSFTQNNTAKNGGVQYIW